MTSSDRSSRPPLAFRYVDAVYEDHPNPEYHGNPLIAGLPFYLTNEELIEALEALPRFDESERDHPDAVRSTYIGRLGRCAVALPRTTVLARALMDLMMEGYVGREPFLPEHRETMQRFYEAKKRGLKFQDLPDAKSVTALRSRDSGAELSTAFIGASGCGKTTTLKLIAGLVPDVIVHDSMWQVPVLLIEMPPGGKTEHGLATAIIDALHRRLPFAGYAEKYLRNVSRKNALERIYDAAALLHTHGVGLLLADESQKEKPTEEQLKRKVRPTEAKHEQLAPEHETPLIQLLIAASNKLGVPLVLVGTNELHDVMYGRFSKERRSVGHGMENWGFLERSGDVRKPNEFEALLRKLWKFQWVRKPVKLSNERADLFFELTQGNPDIVVKLFASAQRRAINEGVEELTEELVRETFKLQFKAVREALKAHEEQDPEKLLNHLDIAPVELRAGPTYAAVAAEMNEKNYQRKRQAEAAAKRKAKEAQSPQAADLAAPGRLVKLSDALKGDGAEGAVHKRLVEAGALAAEHDAV
ncbi:ATP-binding protein [Roseateles sp. NT4]|uniref:ATP-binding protein n=1 Tax=Roseateles sp. NT4 TaxID=3453715 RepID=UPI003EE882B0